jgi:hypothetical protein
MSALAGHAIPHLYARSLLTPITKIAYAQQRIVKTVPGIPLREGGVVNGYGRREK